MFKKIMLASVLMGYSFVSLANWVAGVGYSQLSADDNQLGKLKFGGVSASLGYIIPTDSKWSLIPEFSIGVGTKHDSALYQGLDLDLDIKRFMHVAVKGQYAFDNKAYLFLAPTYANIKAKISTMFRGQVLSETDDSWEFGFAAGVGYDFEQDISAELSYTRFDDGNALNLGLRFRF